MMIKKQDAIKLKIKKKLKCIHTWYVWIKTLGIVLSLKCTCFYIWDLIYNRTLENYIY